MKTRTPSTTIKSEVVTFADRFIACGEFCGAFGFNKQIKRSAFTSNIRNSSKMQVESTLNLTYHHLYSQLAKCTRDDLYSLAQIDIIEWYAKPHSRLVEALYQPHLSEKRGQEKC